MLPIAPIIDLATKLFDRVIEDPEKAAAAKLKLIELEQTGQLRELEASMSAIVEEAKSADPWTSRARPSFLYVVYVIILMAIPMGVLYAGDPKTANGIITGFQHWLAAIPEEMWWLFGAGYLGYSGARSFDKRKNQTR